MAIDFNKMLADLVPTLGQMGVDALVAELESLSKSADEPWQRAVLGLLGNAVEKNGPAGLELAADAIKKALDGDEIPEVDWSDLEAASDLLAILENKEADEKTALEDFMGQASNSLGIILGGLIRGLIGG
jgi:hypothetical protein